MRWRRVRLPRVRFTIGRLMSVVFVAGLASWLFLFALPRFYDQAISLRVAQARLKQATLVSEVAEYALKEYHEGVYKQDNATYEGMIATAKSDQERAADRIRWSSRMREKGFVSDATVIADQLAKQQADFDVEQAQTQLQVLEKYTRQKQMKRLTADVEKTRAVERLRFGEYQAELSKRWWKILGF